MRRFALLTFFIPVFVFTGVAAAGGTTISLVAFSTPKPVMDTLISKWTGTSAGAGVTFTTSYASSGSQARAIIAGLPADIAFLSNALDIDSLVKAGLVTKTWTTKFPQGGIAADSVVTFVVRPGNPKHIHTWADLTQPGVQVVTPDPFPSGGAKWNVLAAYGAQRKMGKSDKQATAYVQKLFHNVVQQDTSASAAMTTFLSGKGDVLLTYESEAYTARTAGKALQIIVPKQTMLIQLPMVPLKTAPTKAAAFIKYCHSYPAQKLFTQAGYRPVVKAVLNNRSLKAWKARFNPGGHVIFSIEDTIFGSWGKANSVWFNPNGRMVKIEQAVEDRPVSALAVEVVRKSRRIGAGGRATTTLALGAISTYLFVIVLLPIAALLWEAKKAGGEGFWQAISTPEAVGALKVTFAAAFIVVALNAVLGTITAWVLVRDDFRGKSLVNAVIDLPFALPTIVAGLTLLTLYGPNSPAGLHLAYTRASVVLALMFVTLPFVVRTVQPVLLELDTEMEEAARSLGASRFTVFRKIVLPNLLPGILSGCVLALARALGEIGAIVIISGNLPYRSEVLSVLIFKQIQDGYPETAAALAVVLLVAAFVLLLGFGALRFFATRHERA